MCCVPSAVVSCQDFFVANYPPLTCVCFRFCLSVFVAVGLEPAGFVAILTPAIFILLTPFVASLVLLHRRSLVSPGNFPPCSKASSRAVPTPYFTTSSNSEKCCFDFSIYSCTEVQLPNRTEPRHQCPKHTTTWVSCHDKCNRIRCRSAPTVTDESHGQNFHNLPRFAPYLFHNVPAGRLKRGGADSSAMSMSNPAEVAYIASLLK